jgi:F0F1-type ATP synthase membrane subunit c/vacuolar-type H+-ATPase subunit K
MRSFRRDESTGTAPIVALRHVFLSFTLALGLVSVVVVLLGDMVDGDEPVELSIGVVTVVGLASLIAGRRIRRSLDCTSDASLVTSYRSRFFLRLALAEAVTMLAFVLGIAVGPWWVYFVGLAFTAIGFARLAPTRRNLERDDAELAAHGCHRSIARLLAHTLTPGT